MSVHPVTCTGCHSALPTTLFNRQELSDCPKCGVPLLVEVFPALFKNRAAGQAGEAVLAGEESSCFYHPQKKAFTVCEACGRFLCGLCDLEFNGQHLCPPCLESGRKKGKMKSLENHRTLYDSVALWIAIVPLLFFPVIIVTGPIAAFVAIRYWSKPSSILPRTHIRKVIAILLGLIETFFGGFFWYLVVTR